MGVQMRSSLGFSGGEWFLSWIKCNIKHYIWFLPHGTDLSMEEKKLLPYHIENIMYCHLIVCSMSKYIPRVVSSMVNSTV